MLRSTRTSRARTASCPIGLLLCFAGACASAPSARPATSPAPAAVDATTGTPALSTPPAPAPSASLAPACPRALSLEPAAIIEEATCLLAAYVRIDTTNPPGNELQAARFLHDVLAREGIASQIIESAPGRANLIARLPASPAAAPPGATPPAASAGSVVLVHHMDVVPASPAEWSAPPFAAELRDGQLWGRGSIDNKGGGVVHLMTMLLAKRLGPALPRELVLLAVADEESGGGHGARFLTEHHMELFQGVDFVLNEGGAVIEPGGGKTIYSVELAQKAPLWLRLTARGPSGHGSAPLPDAAVLTLLRALSRLSAHRFPILVVPAVQALYASKAAAMPEPLRKAYGDLRAALKVRAFREQFLKEPRDAAMVQNTLSITMLQGSDKENVIAGEASAVLDMRLLPGQEAAAVTAEVVRVMAEPGIEVKPILSWQAYSSPRDPRLFVAIEALAQRRNPGAVVAANVIGGFTDCNAFRAKGVRCYGFTPLHVRPETFELIHGKDERIVLQDLGAAVIDLHALLLGLDATEGASR